jgi:hypothetical protein
LKEPYNEGNYTAGIFKSADAVGFFKCGTVVRGKSGEVRAF